uniref:Uncharacterized protein n=1 Tax=Nicotiana tabacum TaxID=4097 RepID=A0A1S4BSK2_TOBAC|nr:PREDICTED: uncharacterized protein LOC107811462 [Nicotiana tabacum]
MKEYDCFAYNILSSPLDPIVKLKADEGTLLPDPTYYRKLVGKLNYLTNTRLDIAYNVQLLIQFMQAPRDTQLTATFHLLRHHALTLESLSLATLFWLETVPLARNQRNKKPFPCPQLKLSTGPSGKWLENCQSAIQIAQNPVFHERTKTLRSTAIF